MTKHNERHNLPGQQVHKHQAGSGIHRDWRLWAAVLLMLGAMGIYVATMDESLEPGGEVQTEVPAAAE